MSDIIIILLVGIDCRYLIFFVMIIYFNSNKVIVVFQMLGYVKIKIGKIVFVFIYFIVVNINNGFVIYSVEI